MKDDKLSFNDKNNTCFAWVQKITHVLQEYASVT